MEKKNKPQTDVTVALLINRARTDLKLASAMIRDLQSVIDEYKLVIDPNDKLFQELSIKIYHFRNTVVSKFMDDLAKDFKIESYISKFNFRDFGGFGGFGGSWYLNPEIEWGRDNPVG